MRAKLPKELKYKTTKNLKRLGREYDGGYLISEKDVANSDVLISFGICDDWSFEEDFIKLKNVPVIAYDGSIDSSVFVAKIIINSLRLNKPLKFSSKLKIFFSYLKFFRGSKTHISKFVSNESKINNKFNKSKYISIDEVLDNEKYNNVFLKVDIEGSEYRILNNIIQKQEKISGLAIEFHDCDLHLDKIIEFKSKFNLNIIHIHANNASPVNLKDEMPQTLEITFSKYSNPNVIPTYPHHLDMPNDSELEEIVLSFN